MEEKKGKKKTKKREKKAHQLLPLLQSSSCYMGIHF